jgi:hypothetical protein
MIIGPRMRLMRKWQIDSKHTLVPGCTIILVRKVDFLSDVAEIDVSGLAGSDDLDIISVPISVMEKYLTIE